MSIAVGVYYEVALWFSFWVIQATFGTSEEHYQWKLVLQYKLFQVLQDSISMLTSD